MKPRQPVGARSFSDQVPNPAQVQPGKDEESACVLSHLFSIDEKGFFVAPVTTKEQPAQAGNGTTYGQTRFHEGPEVPRMRA